MDILKNYVEKFNKNDNELYVNHVDNAHALEWLRDEIPLFECSDKTVEEIYYFRWWTYRKHLKLTPDGYVITEFLPDVPWSGKYNVINAATPHHLAEGRWLKNSDKYLSDYIRFLLNSEKSIFRYSSWLISAIKGFYDVTGKLNADEALVKSLCEYYEFWEQTHGLPNGMFWSIDNYDAMEYSISGTWDLEAKKGIRPTLNSYMCADAYALSVIAQKAGKHDVADIYMHKHQKLKTLINNNLWTGDFYKAFHYEDDNWQEAFGLEAEAIPRELIGYIPWCFDIASDNYSKAFAQLTDPNGFYTPFGLTTAEQRDPRFLYEVDHECLWNGYIWPFATTQTLTALIRYCTAHPEDKENASRFASLFSDYARSHYITTDGKKQPWIDEVKHPHRDEWSSRTILKDWGWRENKGGEERGKDYNHSCFCDIVISGIVGVDSAANEFTLHPLIPENWDYFKLSNLYFRGSTYTVVYDKTGDKYGTGKGIMVYKDGEKYAF